METVVSMAFWVHGLLLSLLFAYRCDAYSTFKSITASSAADLQQWKDVATSPNRMYRANIGIVYDSSNSGRWECQMNVLHIAYETTINASYSCPMATGYNQDFCALAVSQGCLVLLTNHNHAVVSQLTDYQVANQQYLIFKLDNYGSIYLGYSAFDPPPPPPSTSGKSTLHLNMNMSPKTIGITIGGIGGTISITIGVRAYYKSKQEDKKGPKKKKNEQDKSSLKKEESDPPKPPKKLEEKDPPSDCHPPPSPPKNLEDEKEDPPSYYQCQSYCQSYYQCIEGPDLITDNTLIEVLPACYCQGVHNCTC